MRLYRDVLELLDAVDTNIAMIATAYQNAREDEQQMHAARPLIKSSLEHLRSALEYAAQDIWSHYNSKSHRLYFPYGKDEALFKANVKRQMPGLNAFPRIYQLLESLQPFKAGDPWLIQLCTLTNQVKHQSLGEQIRKNSTASSTSIGNYISISGDSSVTIENCSFDGIPVGVGTPLRIASDTPLSVLRSKIHASIPVSRKFDWVKFELDDQGTDALTLISKARTNISNFIEELRSELDPA